MDKLQKQVMDIQKSAVISDDEIYRYELRRWWSDGENLVNFIGLNPSTADSENDDPTLRRCINFARAWGYDGLIMTNLFAYRLTDSGQLKNIENARGVCNWSYLEKCAKESSLIVAAWGAHEMARAGGERTLFRLEKICNKPIHCIARTRSGAPRHPLYLKSDLKPILL